MRSVGHLPRLSMIDVSLTAQDAERRPGGGGQSMGAGSAHVWPFHSCAPGQTDWMRRDMSCECRCHDPAETLEVEVVRPEGILLSPAAGDKPPQAFPAVEEPVPPPPNPDTFEQPADLSAGAALRLAKSGQGGLGVHIAMNKVPQEELLNDEGTGRARKSASADAMSTIVASDCANHVCEGLTSTLPGPACGNASTESCRKVIRILNSDGDTAPELQPSGGIFQGLGESTWSLASMLFTAFARSGTRLDASASKWQHVAVENLQFRDPRILRGAFSTDGLRQGGWIFGCNELTAEHYQWSFETDHIDVFISHNWCMPRLQKFLVLSMHFNATRAIGISMAVVGIMFLMIMSGVIQEWNAREIDKDRTPIFLSSTLVGSMSLVLGILFWADVGRIIGLRGPTVFLDKVCVHQVDEGLKRAGIEHLAAFVHYSWDMVICYSDVYLKKLWTVYEVANVILQNPEGRIHVRPPVLAGLVLLGQLLSCLHCVVSVILQRTTVWNTYMDGDHSHLVLALGGVLSLIAVSLCLFLLCFRWVQEQAKINDRLQRFSLDQAACFSEEDRKVVQKNIIAFMKFYNVVDADSSDRVVFDAFEAVVRERVPDLFAASLGRVGVPYQYAFIMGLPYVFFRIDSFAGSLANDVVSMLDAALTCQEIITFATAITPLHLASFMDFSRQFYSQACRCHRWFRMGLWVCVYTIFIPFLFIVYTAVRGRAARGSIVSIGAMVSACFLLMVTVVFVYRPLPFKQYHRTFKRDSM